MLVPLLWGSTRLLALGMSGLLLLGALMSWLYLRRLPPAPPVLK